MASLRGTYYEILGIDPKATDEELERAYRFSLDLYSDEAMATYSLLDPQEIIEARARIQEAYSVLRDPARRHAYDLGQASTPPTLSTPTPLSVATASPADRPPGPRSLPRTLPDPVTGADLKRFREMRGVTLRDIATASKIGVRFLEYIEADRHSHLPAPVYLRSFLQEYAKAVGLEPRRTAESYMAGLSKQT